MSIRVLVIGAGKFTASRVKELSGGFNIFADTPTGQSFRTVMCRAVRKPKLQRFPEAVWDREFGDWDRPFQISVDELPALISIPALDQENIRTAPP